MIYDMGMTIIHSMFLKELENGGENKESEVFKCSLVKMYKCTSRLMGAINTSIFGMWIDKPLMINIVNENYYRSKAQIYSSLIN